MTNSHPRRRFLQITAVGAGLASAASLYGANQAGAVTSGLTALTHPGVLHSRADRTHSCCGLTKLIRSGSGQCCESGRDQAHTQLILGSLAEICQTGWVQGLDMFGANNSLLLSGYEYTAKYNLGNSVPYDATFGRCSTKWPSLSARGSFRNIYEIAYNH